MLIDPDTCIILQFPEADDMPEIETTWGEFAAGNDTDTVAYAAEQIEADNYAVIGGGATPLVWIFA